MIRAAAVPTLFGLGLLILGYRCPMRHRPVVKASGIGVLLGVPLGVVLSAAGVKTATFTCLLLIGAALLILLYVQVKRQRLVPR